MDVFRHHRVSGFTIAEFIVVIIIVGIMAAMALPRWIGSDTGLNAQAEALAADIRFAQSLAMTQATHYRSTVLSGNTYNTTHASGTPVLNPTKGTATVTLNDSVVFGTLTGLPSNLIAFDGQGVPYTDSAATTTPLATTATIPLTVSSSTCTLQITQATGKVSVSC
mgnify:CR=1 FL=1